MITTDGQENVLKNLNAKAQKASEMFDMLVKLMQNELVIEKKAKFTKEVNLPTWL